MKARPIHISHPNGAIHPLKRTTLCGKLVRFGGFEIKGERPATCKTCLKINSTICQHCEGTGVSKNELVP